MTDSTLTEGLSARTLCVVSRRFRFICLLIAKNASSALREELGKPRYAGYECPYVELDRDVRANFFTFAVLREPVSRILSAYLEVSRRIETGYLGRGGLRFCDLPDTPARFSAFLGEIEVLMPEPHVRRQAEYVHGIRVDFFATRERLQLDLEEVHRMLRMGPCPIFPKRRPRVAPGDGSDQRRFVLSETSVDAATRRRILEIYTADAELYECVRSQQA